MALSLSLLLCFAMLAAAVNASPDLLLGPFLLTAAKDHELLNVVIPVPEYGGPFTLELDPQPEMEDFSYTLSLKIGNRMTADLKVLGERAGDGAAFDVSVGTMISTRMMPPPEVYKLEMALNSIMPKVQRMELLDNSRLLLFSGPEGSVEFTRQA